MSGQNSQAILNEVTRDKADVVEMGTEKVGGYACKKTKYMDEQMGTATYWISTVLELPLKHEIENASGTMRSEHRNIKERSQPTAFFKVPSDYTKFAVPNLPTGVKIPGLRSIRTVRAVAAWEPIHG